MQFYIQDPLKHLRKNRDLTMIEINDRQYLVIACDSDGGIGNKEQDVVKVSEKKIAQFATRVPLFEIISCGAKPFLLIDCLSVELDPMGNKIIAEIKDYVKEIGITEDIQFTGSTEDNVPTIQTGIGVTIIGLVDKENFPIGSSSEGDKIVCVGQPKSAPQHEVKLDDPEIISLADLQKVRENSLVKDILPVGSKGVLYEANQLAESAELSFKMEEDIYIDPIQSAGPSTCVLISIKEEHINTIKETINAPIYLVGTLIGR